MTTQTVAGATERVEATLVATVARKEISEAVRSKWFWMWTIAFAGLAAFMASVALPGSQVAGFGSFGRTAASLVALAQIIVPLMGLTLGAYSIAGQRENGALRFLLSHPISRSEAFLGTYLGLAASLAATVFGGFGIAGIITVMQGGGANAGSFVRIAILSWLLAISMLGFGMLISTFAGRGGSALGIAVFVWLALAFVGDLGVMGSAMATRSRRGGSSSRRSPIRSRRSGLQHSQPSPARWTSLVPRAATPSTPSATRSDGCCFSPLRCGQRFRSCSPGSDSREGVTYETASVGRARDCRRGRGHGMRHG
jgi:ABC-type transport system involved in multi-copper enzyme maturation permease subunit